MTKTIPAGIYQLIDSEFKHSRELLDILSAEQSAVVGMDMQALVELSRSKADKINQLKELDEQLRQLVEETSGLPSENAVRLSDLAGLAEPAERDRLLKLKQELVALRQDIAAKSVINHHYVEDTKRHLHEAVRTITTAATNENVNSGYAKPGRNSQLKPGVSPRMFSRSV